LLTQNRVSAMAELDRPISNVGPSLYIVERGVGFGAAREAAGEDTLDGVLERLSEVSVEVGVDERVEGGVEVADPEQHGDYYVRAVTRVSAQRCDHVPV
jgi:hypothetical protein